MYGFKKKQEMTSSAELCVYWPSCPVLAEFVTHMIRAAFATEILYY